MINFDEEIRKFQPSLEVSQVEEAVYKNDTKDITDILEEMVMQLNRGQEI